jgi:hypothetical protein
MVVDFLKAIIDLGIGYFWLFLIVIFALLGEIGFRLGRRSSVTKETPEGAAAGISTLTGGMMGLLAFTLALAISFAQTRYEARRDATLAEANATGTAWQRADLIGEPGKAIADKLLEHARQRLAYIQAKTPKEAMAALERVDVLETDIWQRAVAIAKVNPTPTTALLISALNDTFDAALIQRYATESRVPMVTALMLMGGALLAMGALGYQLGIAGNRQYALTPLLIFMLSGGLVLIVDFNRPNGGFTQTDATPMIWTIQSMTPASPK